jgi:DNA topoisomerase-1
MPRKGGWRREGSRGRFRYVDARGNLITDEDSLERIKSLVIPPAWKDVWISASASSKLQATGVDGAGRKQYLYHPSFRAQREQEKFDKLIRFAEGLPDLREVMAEHMDNDLLDRDRVSAMATRLINRGWFRVGTERYAKESKTFGITTLRRNHVTVRGHRIAFHFRGKHRSEIRTTLVDSELAESVKELLALPRGARLFRYDWDGELWALTGAKLNEYVRTNLGEDFTAKDFRTWRHIAGGDRPGRARAGGVRPRRSGPSLRSCAGWGRSSETRPQLRAGRTSARR